MDNYYTSPDLVAKLMIAGTGVTGTMGPTEKNLHRTDKKVSNSLKKGNLLNKGNRAT